jgi:hypothetical protein
MMHDELMIPSVQDVDHEYMVLLAKHAWSATPVKLSFDWRFGASSLPTFLQFNICATREV